MASPIDELRGLSARIRGSPPPPEGRLALRDGPPQISKAPLHRAERRRDKAVATLAKLERDARIPDGVVGWNVKLDECKTLLADLAARRVEVRPYELLTTPSRDGKAAAAHVAMAGHAQRKQVRDAYPLTAPPPRRWSAG